MTALQKAKALVAGGLADDLAEAAGQLLDMGEIAQTQADRILLLAARTPRRRGGARLGPERTRGAVARLEAGRGEVK